LIILIKISVMSIILNIIPEANDLTNCLTLLGNVTTPLMGVLMAYRNYFIEIGKQSDALYTSSKKVF
jgi:cytosine/uracil/thiamine/allantoin permease